MVPVLAPPSCGEDCVRKSAYGSQYAAWHIVSAQKMFAIKIITSISHGNESKYFSLKKSFYKSQLKIDFLKHTL